jgi:hypothetical protein
MLHKFLRTIRANSQDPYFKQVSLLLHGDGTNGSQNNTFLDSSTNNLTITRVSTATQGTFVPFSQDAGYWSNFFDGTSDRLTIADNANLRPGTSNFTIEAWIYRSASGAAHTIFAKGASTPTGFAFLVTSTNVLRFTDTSSNIDSTVTIPANTWTHVAAVREGTGSNQFKLYINGVNDGTGTVSTNYNQTEEARIGENRGATDDFNGYISNLRLVIGTAVYTANFTPSTIPLTAITNTQLLTCQSSRFLDNSSNNFTVTPVNNTAVQPFSAFAPTSAYSTSNNGGSVRLNGTSDSLTVANSSSIQLGSSDFTIEFWVYFFSFSNSPQMFNTNTSNPANHSYALVSNSSGAFSYFLSSSGTAWNVASGVSVGTARINSWNHVALVRNGTTVTPYLNGVSGTTTTTSATLFAFTSVLNIGYIGFNTNNIVNGYISNFRIVKGTAVYTANFTPPTAPLTAITNTQLLLNGTNAGIFDNAMKNNLVTVGNAQVSTSVTKFGTGSMSFDGTGDWLTSPDTPNLQFGTGKFTIEGWFYLNAVGSVRGFVSKGTSTTGWSLGTNSSNQVVFSHTATSFASTGTLLISTWYHITIVREGTGANETKIYINGTNDGTSTVATNFNQTSIMYVGADRVGSSALNGYIDDLRITKGVARYTANFTPPSAPYPNS